MTYDGNQPNFKSPTSLQMDTWKKGLEVVLQPNSTLVMTTSTLVMFESKTSTGHQERGSAAERTLCKVPSMPNVPSVFKHQAMCVRF